MKIMLMRLAWYGDYEPLDLVLHLPKGRGSVMPEKKEITKRGGGKPAGKIKSHLDALEAARKAGILSDEEYRKKKAKFEAELKAKSTPLDPATQKKLKALESAYKAGILSEEEYTQKKAALTKSESKETSFSSSVKKGKVYRHPIGFTFGYPEDWTLQEQDEFLQLIPPNPESTKEGPTELYILIGESVAGEGIYDPAHPLVVSYLDDAMRSLAPFMTRTGRAEPVKLKQGKGVLIKWKGKNPNGDEVFGRAFVTIQKEHGVALIGLGLKSPLNKREPDLHRMFQSFGFNEGEKDPRLVGTWNLTGTHSIYNESPFVSDWERAQLVSESQSMLEFRPDGTWRRTDKSHMIAGAGDVWLESEDASASQGRWFAGEGLLYMIWDDNSWNDYKYQVQSTPEGRQLRLVSGNSGEIWSAQ
jgi:hypothetical protein